MFFCDFAMALKWLDEFSLWPSFCVVYAVQLAHIEHESMWHARQHAVFFVSEVAFLENHRKKIIDSRVC